METTVSQVFCLYQFENKFIYAHNRDKKACFQAKDFTILTFPPVQGSFLFLFSSQGNITEPFLVSCTRFNMTEGQEFTCVCQV